MKQIFSEYGKVLIASLGSIAMISLCNEFLVHGDAWRMMLYFWMGGGAA